MKIQPVSFDAILDAPNAKELLAEYEAECSLPQIGKTNPQREMYAEMERSGMCQMFGAFERLYHPLDDAVLVGFASILTYVLPHYGQKIATVESLFLARAHRTGRAGNALMSAIEQYAKEKGCVVILYSARTGSQFERLLSVLKPYERTNSNFLRAL